MTVPATPMWLGELGLWVGILLSLAIFSLLICDNGAARLAQHILVGAGLGYVVVLLLRDLFWYQLAAPLLRNPSTDPVAWVLLGLLLLIGLVALARIVVRDAVQRGTLRFVFLSGMVPVALSMGFAAAAVIIGVVQGTLAPQFLRAAATGSLWDAPPLQTLTGLLMLLVTTGVLIHVRSRPDRDFAWLPGPLRGFVGAWAGIGKRALWLTAGVIFARLIASRISLLGGQLQWLLETLYATRLWAWFVGLF